jgi:hypothetical protein
VCKHFVAVSSFHPTGSARQSQEWHEKKHRAMEKHGKFPVHALRALNTVYHVYTQLCNIPRIILEGNTIILPSIRKNVYLQASPKKSQKTNHLCYTFLHSMSHLRAELEFGKSTLMCAF